MRRRKKDPESCDEKCFNCRGRFSCRKRALIGYERLAFGSTADAFALLMSGGDETPDVSRLDLFNVAEIKRPKDGAMESKFFDRLKALEQLANIPEESSAVTELYNALSRCAPAAGSGDPGESGGEDDAGSN